MHHPRGWDSVGATSGIRYKHHVTDTPALPNKKDVTRSFLLRGSVFLHLDPRRDGVVVPEWLRKQPQLVLQIGLDMPIPIPDLRVDDNGTTGSLSFNRTPCLCIVPWDAVFAVVGEDGRGMVWPESMPAEIAAEVEREAKRSRLRDASAPEPPRSTLADDLRDRVTAPAPAAPAVKSVPSPAAAPTPALDRRESAIRQPRKPRLAALESEPPQKRVTPSKEPATGGKRGKRPLPPYLRVVK